MVARAGLTLSLSLCLAGRCASALEFIGEQTYNTSRVPSLIFTSDSLRHLPAVQIGVSLQIDCCSSQSARGRSMLESWELLISFVNDVHGGIIVNGQLHRVELVTLGDYSDSTITESNIYSLLARGVRLFLGPFGSGQSSLAASAVHSVPDALLMATAASSTTVFAGKPRVFGIFSPGGSYFATVLRKFAADNVIDVALLVEDFGPARSWGEGARVEIEHLGMNLLSDVTVPRFASEADLTAEVKNWANMFGSSGSEPLILLATYEIQTCISLAREAVRQRLPRRLMVFTNCVDKAEFASEPLETRAYVAGVAPWNPHVHRSAAYDPWTNASAAEYTATFEKFTGNSPDYVDAAAYGGLGILLTAIQATATTNVTVLKEYLVERTHPTIYGEITYDANHQNDLALRLMQYQWQPDPLQSGGGTFELKVVQGTTEVAPTLSCIGLSTANYDQGRCESVIFTTTGIIIVSMSVLVVLMGFGMLLLLRHQRARKRARLLLYLKNDREVRLPALLVPYGYHIFLSHVWISGQDQMRILKQRLIAMMPEIRVFLDVDDLKHGRGGEDIDRSNVVLVFVSSGYFASQNCMRELLRAVATGKSIITVCETSVNKGALSRGEVLSALQAADRRYHEVWGDSILAEEAARWLEEADALSGHGKEVCEAIVAQRPVAEDLDAILFGEPGAIEWTRVDAFQDVTLRLIAERVLPGDDAIYMKSVRKRERKVASQPLQPLLGLHEFHLFCSPHNVGAFELLREASDFFEWKLETTGMAGAGTRMASSNDGEMLSSPVQNPPTRGGLKPRVLQASSTQLARYEHSAVSMAGASTPVPLARAGTQKLRHTVLGRGKRQTLNVSGNPNDLSKCRQMLVYLNALTWTSGKRSELLARDIKLALDHGTDLLLVHETPNVSGAEARHGVDFGKFFACAEGATPKELIQSNIYLNVAVPLKDGAWRAASMYLFAENLAQQEGWRLNTPDRWGSLPGNTWTKLFQRDVNSARPTTTQRRTSHI